MAEAGFDWCVATSREKCAQENSNERLGGVVFSCDNIVSQYLTAYADIHTYMQCLEYISSHALQAR